MKTLEATYQIVTPMFIGDAEQKATSIRPPSIKGALRFWWRALNWGEFRSKTSDDVNALKELHKEECHLFGAAATDDGKGGQKGGQGVFLLQITEQPKIIPNSSWPENANSGSGYMGFGLLPLSDDPHRQAIDESKNFTMSLLFKPKTSNLDIENIKKTLEIFGLFGGLGSRVRNGFGSISLVSLDDEEYNFTLNEYLNKINLLLDNYKSIKNTYPPYTAFSKHACFGIVKDSEANDAKVSHNKAGNTYKVERSGDSYNGIKAKIKWEDRISLGLPLNIEHHNNDNTEVSLCLNEEGNKDIRRSSPLFFHVHPIKDGKERKFVTGVLYLPAQFHYKYPDGYPISDDIELEKFYQPTKQLLDMTTT